MTPLDQIPYRRLFPWLHVFRAIGLAFSFRQLLVAAGAIGALWLGEFLIARLASDSVGTVRFPSTHLQLQAQLLVNVIENRPSEIRDGVTPIPVFSLAAISDLAGPWQDITLPAIVATNSNMPASLRWQSAVGCTWGASVWSLFGLALCRLAARRLARDEEGSFRKAIQFGVTRWRHGVVAPVIPAAAALSLMGFAVLLALPGRFPFAGSFNAVVATPFILGCGLVASFLTFATILGWPLMLAAIAYDDCDGFGGLSRSYSLWTGRPWRFAWCVLMAAAGGCVGMFVAALLAFGSGHAADYAIRLGMGNSIAAGWAGTTCKFLIMSAITSYAFSFFWTSATIVYALLRQSVDGVPLDVMAPDDDERPARDPLPVVGMPAVNPSEPPTSSATG